FDAIAIGSSQLTLTPNTFGSGVFFTDPLGQTLLETSVDGRIDVTQQAVGEPGTLALGLFALLVAWTTNIRRRHYLQPH
ncbi:MAG: hypothetical protein GY927_13085, partial [bacterium]|nr:hypothetical protein [bacterium]